LHDAYLPFACLEFGMFRALNLAARESMSDTVNNVFVFYAADKLRHAQDICLLGLDLEVAVAGFDGLGGADEWVSAESWQPARALVEELIATRDWMEIAAAAVFALEPILSAPLRQAVFSRAAAHSGDLISPVISLYASSGEANRDVVRGWAESWQTKTEPVAHRLFSHLETTLSRPGLVDNAVSVGLCEQTRVRDALSDHSRPRDNDRSEARV
jgi:hypothetical protein